MTPTSQAALPVTANLPTFEKVKTGATKYMAKAQEAAKTVLNVSTNPGTVFLVASTAVLSLATGSSALRSFLTNVGSLGIGLFAAWTAMAVRVKLTPKPPVVEEPAKPALYPVMAVTKENFKKEVLGSKVPVVLDAYASWCPPCKMMAPVFEDLSEEMAGKIKFVKMNVDEQQALGKDLKIEAMPTFIFFKNGKEVDRHRGAMPKADLLSKCVAQFM